MIYSTENPYVKAVMQRFSCSKQMAEKIIESSELRGETESLKRMVSFPEHRDTEFGGRYV